MIANGVQTTRPTVLVVDDEPLVRLMCDRMLKEMGYLVVTAGNGREALSLVQSATTPFTVVLTDVRMPELDGIRLAEQLMAAPPVPRIILMSGFVPVERGSAPLGAIPFLRKPFNSADRQAAIDRVLGTAQA